MKTDVKAMACGACGHGMFKMFKAPSGSLIAECTNCKSTSLIRTTPLRNGTQSMNPFIPADALEFEIVGFYEEFLDADTCAFLGTRSIPEPDRPLGSHGRKTYTLEQSITVYKGYKRKEVTLRPGRRVISMLQIMCGRKHDTGFELSPKRHFMEE